MSEDKKTTNGLYGLMMEYPAFPAALVALICFGLGLYWIMQEPVGEKEFMVRRPVFYDRTASASSQEDLNLGTLIPGTATASNLPGSWPWFRGPQLENIADSGGELARDWPEEGPPVLWRVEMGEGHAGAAILNGMAYVTDYDREKEEDAIRCLNLKTGEEIWRFTYSVSIKRNHGMSRTIPAVTDDYVVSLGPKLHLVCLDAKTGEKKWSINMVEEYQCTVPPWYAGQCPVIEGDTVVIAPGTKPLMLALDLETGEEVWRTAPELDNMGMTHSSILPIEFAGEKQFVYCTGQGVVSISAEDHELLWTKPEWKIGIANVPSPVYLGPDDGRIFFSGGYNAGSMMVKLVEQGDGTIGVEELYALKAQEFGSDQQTPIFYKGHIYGVKPKPAEMVCLKPDTGEWAWSSGRTRFGLGPYLLVGDLFYVLDDREGALHIVEATPEEYRELDRFDLLDGHDAWAPMAYADGLLLLRDMTEMVCVDLRK
ncbi:MAG: PQQ-binding-like beta-propeller repeat protein [Candidatus Sumerlaeia bacterium]